LIKQQQNMQQCSVDSAENRWVACNAGHALPPLPKLKIPLYKVKQVVSKRSIHVRRHCREIVLLQEFLNDCGDAARYLNAFGPLHHFLAKDWKHRQYYPRVYLAFDEGLLSDTLFVFEDYDVGLGAKDHIHEEQHGGLLANVDQAEILRLISRLLPPYIAKYLFHRVAAWLYRLCIFCKLCLFEACI
jgi:hypothetical protein